MVAEPGQVGQVLAPTEAAALELSPSRCLLPSALFWLCIPAGYSSAEGDVLSGLLSVMCPGQRQQLLPSRGEAEGLLRAPSSCAPSCPGAAPPSLGHP